MKNTPISRRRHLGLCGTALSGLLPARYLSAAPASSTELKPNPKFQPVYDALADQMRRLYEICRVKIDGRELLRPSAWLKTSWEAWKNSNATNSSMLQASPAARLIFSAPSQCR